MDPINSGMFTSYRPLLIHVIEQRIHFHLSFFTLRSDTRFSLKRPLPITPLPLQLLVYTEANAALHTIITLNAIVFTPSSNHDTNSITLNRVHFYLSSFNFATGTNFGR